MKTLGVFVFCLMASLGTAQVNDKAPFSPFSKGKTIKSASRGLGDVNWSLDLNAAWGDERTLGVEFDGTHYWVTSAFDTKAAYLYQCDPSGNIINTFNQPATNVGAWGWRDLAWDGQYLYAGDDTTKPGYITQIDPSNGQPTGVYYGPVATLSVCRALAYCSATDTFYTANWSSEIFNVTRNNVVTQAHPPTGYSCFGMAMEESAFGPKLWLWTYTNIKSQIQAFEWDPATKSFTGKGFAPDPVVYGSISGGACAYPTSTGAWELCAMSQTPGTAGDLHGYDLTGAALEAFPDNIKTEEGGLIQFFLNATSKNANRNFLIFGGYSGASPGFNLPLGGAVVGVNWDGLTSALIGLGWGFGTLDPIGQDVKTLGVPKNLGIPVDLDLVFAYVLEGPPWDFASNTVEVKITAYTPPIEYSHDDGTTENALGLTTGGEICWMHLFDSGPGDTIFSISSAFGDPNNPGFCPSAGAPITVAVWDDVNNDGDPSDGVLLGSATSVLQNPDTNTLNVYAFPAAIGVTGKFVVGCVTDHIPGNYPAPMDQDPPISGFAWVCGHTASTFDYNNLLNNNVPPMEMGTIGWSVNWLLRAQN